MSLYVAESNSDITTGRTRTFSERRSRGANISAPLQRFLTDRNTIAKRQAHEMVTIEKYKFFQKGKAYAGLNA
jgi:hypothetical protein